MAGNMICSICKTESKPVFSKMVLKKYNVTYFQCIKCQFLQTEKAYWLEEAYSSAITNLDIGLLDRNIRLRKKLSTFIKENFDGKFLDYAGGYGTFTRLMRDQGFDFYHHDKYCANIFAKDFEHDADLNNNYSLITCFEVFEHLVNPGEELEKMLTLSDSILFTTELQPTAASVEDWWYIVPETGQHISFYTIESLQRLAKIYGLNFYSDGSSVHLFTKKIFKRDILVEKGFKNFIEKLKSAFQEDDYTHLQQDFLYVKNLNN